MLADSTKDPPILRSHEEIWIRFEIAYRATVPTLLATQDSECPRCLEVLTTVRLDSQFFLLVYGRTDAQSYIQTKQVICRGGVQS